MYSVGECRIGVYSVEGLGCGQGRARKRISQRLLSECKGLIQ